MITDPTARAQPAVIGVPPTLVSDVDPASEIARNEVFGPVFAAMTFATVEEAVALANGTDYGLIAAVWTKDIDIAFCLSEELMAGEVDINTYGAGGGWGSRWAV